MSSPWAHNEEERRIAASIDAKIDRKANPNPMHSRCGLEDCDCEYTIEELLTALERLCRGHNMRGSDGPCSCSSCLTYIKYKKEG